jgi:hypothetical protein
MVLNAHVLKYFSDMASKNVTNLSKMSVIIANSIFIKSNKYGKQKWYGMSIFGGPK